jgi:hypothetical protein
MIFLNVSSLEPISSVFDLYSKGLVQGKFEDLCQAGHTRHVGVQMGSLVGAKADGLHFASDLVAIAYLNFEHSA